LCRGYGGGIRAFFFVSAAIVKLDIPRGKFIEEFPDIRLLCAAGMTVGRAIYPA
jgi:hypothetical protein